MIRRNWRSAPEHPGSGPAQGHLARGPGRAAELVAEGGFGRMASLRGNAVTDVPLADATATLKTVPEEYYRLAEPFFG